MNFIFVSLQRINTDRESTSTCLAKELAKRHNVLYVNSPIDRKTYYAKEKDIYTQAHIDNIQKKEPKLQQLQDRLWVLHPHRIIESINWLPFTPVFKAINWVNNWRLSKDIQEAIKALKFDSFILINDKDIFRSFYLKEILKPEKYIYLDRDYTVGMGYWKRHGTSLEPQLMQKADAVVCNSTDFAKRAQLYNPNSFYIGNGGDVTFAGPTIPGKEPKDLTGISHPRIGYVGALTSLRLDIDLIINLAKARPNWQLVLIGPEDEDFQRSVLHELKNVHFLGKKESKEVPAYLSEMDVCINPQVLNEITIGNFPMKAVEYLALGKPVVATATNTMKEVFSQHTYLAEGDGFIRQIEKALAEDNEEKRAERIRFARKFSWENVASRLMDCIKQIA